MNRFFGLASADIVVPNMEAWHLLWDFQTLRELTDSLPGNTELQNKALVTANAIMNVFEKGDIQSLSKARELAQGVFGEAWQKKAEKVYDEGAEKAQIWGIGHCHIDTAWWVHTMMLYVIEPHAHSFNRLWPYRVTQQKVARSWSTQVDLMERYPEHRFTCSQAQQYKWLEQVRIPRVRVFSLCTDSSRTRSSIPHSSTASRRRLRRASSTPWVGHGSRTTRTCPPAKP